MVEGIVVSKTIGGTSCIIGRVNVNEFDLSAELLLKRVKRDEIIAFDNKVLAKNTVRIPLEFANYPPPLITC